MRHKKAPTMRQGLCEINLGGLSQLFPVKSIVATGKGTVHISVIADDLKLVDTISYFYQVDVTFAGQPMGCGVIVIPE